MSKPKKTNPFKPLILTILLVITLLNQAPAMEIYVNTQEHGSLTIVAEPTTKIGQVKLLIENKTGVFVKQQILKKQDGTMMEDQHTLQDYSVQKEDTIYLEVIAEKTPIGWLAITVLLAGSTFFLWKKRGRDSYHIVDVRSSGKSGLPKP